MTRKLFVICYDVSDDARRLRVARALEKVAVRVQGSVFEWRTDAVAAARLGERLAPLIKPGDSLRIYHVPDAALRYSNAIGGAPLAEPGDYLLF